MSANHVRAREPESTRKSLFAHPRTLLLALLAIVFTAYVLGYLPQLDALFGSAIEDSRLHGLVIVGPAILLIVGLFVVFVLLLILGYVGTLIRSIGRSLTFSGRRHTTVHQFTIFAQVQGLNARIAKETYELLRPHYPAKMCISLEDDLRSQLRLSDENILYLQSRLLNRCDRREVRAFSVESIETVFDLMQHVEGAPPQHISGVELRRRSTDLDPGVVKDRRSAVARRASVSGASAADAPALETPNLRIIPDRRSIFRRAEDRPGPEAAKDEADAAQPPQTAMRNSGSRLGLAPIPLIESRVDAGIDVALDVEIALPRNATVDYLPPASIDLSNRDRASQTDPHYLPPRRREPSGVLRRINDPAIPATEGEHVGGSSLDDPDFRSRTRPDYSGILRRATDSTEAASSANDPGVTQIAGRRLGDAGIRTQLTPDAVSPTGTSEEGIFLAPRRISETGFRRRTTDPPSLKPESDDQSKD